MPTQAQNIPHRGAPNGDSLSRAVSNSYESTSPNATFQSPPSSFSSQQRQSTKQLKPFHTQDIKVLLLENVNQTGQEILRKQGYQVEAVKSSLPENELIEKIK